MIEFGMTPSSRVRVKAVPAVEAVDPNRERYFGSGH